MIAIVLRRYVLIRPVVGFREDTKQVLTIPAGTVITLPERQTPVGIASFLWDGHTVMVFREDVEDNGFNPKTG
jgi:hypothetical protein